MNRRELLASMASTLALGATPALAQEKYPTRPVRVLVPYTPGGATDIAARVVGEQLRKFSGSNS
jgi:tripartite-type tricarboxylate transporter receptor subunit TctC